jgi:enoyl-CoA hydratase/carnithine racemase
VSDLVTIEVVGGLAYATIVNPPVNALSVAVLEALAAAIRRLDGEPDIAVIVVRGAGRAFAAGGDIQELAAIEPAAAASYARAAQAAVCDIARCGKVVIAQVHGFALGGGTEIALAADFRIASEDATFGLPEVLLGLVPGVGGTHRLRRVVGRTKAKELILSGRMVSADDALTIGLVDCVVPRAELAARVASYAMRFTASSPRAVRAAKGLIDADDGDPLGAESAVFAELLSEQDARIGLTSFLTTGALGQADFTSDRKRAVR